MEINITAFFRTAVPMDYAASVAEIGECAGAATWQAACEDSPEYFMLDDDEKRDAFRRYMKGFGAWTEEEIAAWSDVELNARFIQMVAGDLREADLTPDSDDADWIAYETRAEVGHCSSNIFRSADGLTYYYIGD